MVVVQRGDAVDDEQVRIAGGLHAAPAQAIRVHRRVPLRVEPRHQLVSDVPVASVRCRCAVPWRDARHHCGHQCKHRATSGVGLGCVALESYKAIRRAERAGVAQVRDSAARPFPARMAGDEAMDDGGAGARRGAAGRHLGEQAARGRARPRRDRPRRRGARRRPPRGGRRPSGGRAVRLDRPRGRRDRHRGRADRHADGLRRQRRHRHARPRHRLRGGDDHLQRDRRPVPDRGRPATWPRRVQRRGDGHRARHRVHPGDADARPADVHRERARSGSSPPPSSHSPPSRRSRSTACSSSSRRSATATTSSRSRRTPGTRATPSRRATGRRSPAWSCW